MSIGVTTKVYSSKLKLRNLRMAIDAMKSEIKDQNLVKILEAYYEKTKDIEKLTSHANDLLLHNILHAISPLYTSGGDDIVLMKIISFTPPTIYLEPTILEKSSSFVEKKQTEQPKIFDDAPLNTITPCDGCIPEEIKQKRTYKPRQK